MDPYAEARKMDILTDVGMQLGMSLERIASRVIANREKISAKFQAGKKKEAKYKETLGFMNEI